jgi:biotin-dependent carboxylase-like uncharacterized protein
MNRAIEVVRAGPLTTIQDRGRPGFAHLGVPRSGALDGPARALANRLVGNGEDAAALETTLGGVSVRVLCPCVVAVTGAESEVSVDGRPAVWSLAVALAPGQVLDVGPALSGLRAYVAISGGIGVQPVLGSRSTDVFSGLGPAPLRDGDRVALGAPAGPPATIDVAPLAEPPDPLVLRLSLGPRHDWFTMAALRTLADATYVVSPVSNRVGMRLDGPALERQVGRELPSEGLVLGAVQVPADGRPLVFLADHPTTGGYPVIGVVEPHDLPPCAQARPGATVRFSVVRGGDGYGARP